MEITYGYAMENAMEICFFFWLCSCQGLGWLSTGQSKKSLIVIVCNILDTFQHRITRKLCLYQDVCEIISQDFLKVLQHFQSQMSSELC